MKKHSFHLLLMFGFGVLFSLFSANEILAQSFTVQVQDFEKSFQNKDTSYIMKHISPKLKFVTYEQDRTAVVLHNIITSFPKLNSITIISEEESKVKVKFDFEEIQLENSTIYFDKNKLINRIEFVDDIINAEIERNEVTKSIKRPLSPSYADRYRSEQIQFESKDGLTVYADLYEVSENNPTILLCHQAGYNRKEYMDIAPKLCELGFNCLAIDQRSGGVFVERKNLTNEMAKSKGIETEMYNAVPDLEASIQFLNEKYKQNIIVWGSSYSASLALYIGSYDDRVKAILAFSPGNYFGDKIPNLEGVFAELKKPYLVTSSKKEAEKIKLLIGDSNSAKKQIQFVPNSNGHHGSRVLWTGQSGGDEYWTVVKDFLSQLK